MLILFELLIPIYVQKSFEATPSRFECLPKVI